MRCGGFTLVEITFAILILAGSLIVLIGLQTSVLQRTTRDVETQQAVMFARQILSAVESLGMSETPIPLDIQDRQGTIAEILETLIEPDPEDRRRLEEDSAWYRARLLVEPWGIPRVDEEAMKRVQVTIFRLDEHSDALRELLSVQYYIPRDEGLDVGAGEAEEDEESLEDQGDEEAQDNAG